MLTCDPDCLTTNLLSYPDPFSDTPDANEPGFVMAAASAVECGRLPGRVEEPVFDRLAALEEPDDARGTRPESVLLVTRRLPAVDEASRECGIVADITLHKSQAYRLLQTLQRALLVFCSGLQIL